MRAGTSIPGLALGGISQMQSPAWTTLLSRLPDVFMPTPLAACEFFRILLDVDHEPRAPSALDPLQGELVEGQGLGVGAEGGAPGIDDATLELGPKMKGAVPPHADLAAREHLSVAILEKDQLRHPII